MSVESKIYLYIYITDTTVVYISPYQTCMVLIIILRNRIWLSNFCSLSIKPLIVISVYILAEIWIIQRSTTEVKQKRNISWLNGNSNATHKYQCQNENQKPTRNKKKMLQKQQNETNNMKIIPLRTRENCVHSIYILKRNSFVYQLSILALLFMLLSVWYFNIYYISTSTYIYVLIDRSQVTFNNNTSYIYFYIIC